MSAISLPKESKGLRDLGYLQDIPAVRQLGMLALVAGTIALGLWLFFWTQKPDYVPVQAGLDAKSSSEASDLLAAAKIPYRIEPSGALAVPTDQVAAARLALAAAGLPNDNNAGMESLQGDQGFGTSQFIENARYQQALQNELARTIATLRPVREARVHLALPKPSAFTRQKEPASASVVLEMRGGSTLEQGQVNAIVHLVASSIPDLAPERVTVVDQFGRMLSNADPDGEDAIGARQFDQQRRQEAVYVQRIQELLEPMTGPGRVSAQVSVDMDFARTEEASERYGPQSNIRSEQLSESGNLSSSNAAAPAQGVPGSASNTPQQAASTATPPANANANAQTAEVSGPGSRSSVRNYEIDRTLTHTTQAPGRIRRVTAAVLVDNVPQGAGEAGKPPKLRPLAAAELKRIETLVQQAIGFDGQRGDTVSVVNAPFARDVIDSVDDAPPIWEQPRARDLTRVILGGLAVLLLIFFVLRPAFRALLAPKTRKVQEITATMVDPDEEIPVSLSAPARKDKTPSPALMNFDEKLEVARSAVNTDAKRVAQVVRSMVESDG